MSQIKRAAVSIVFVLVSLSTAYCQERVLGNPESIVYDISFSKGGSWLAATEEKGVKLFDVKSGQVLQRFDGGHKKEVLAVDISVDSTRMASGGQDGLLVIWDIETGKLLEELSLHQGVVTAVMFHPERKLLISAGSDNKVFVYDYQQKQVLFELTRHTDDVTALALSHDKTILASAGADKKILLWSLASGKLLTEIQESTSWIRALSFTPDGKSLLSAGDDRKIHRWHLENSFQVYKGDVITGSTGWLLSLDSAGDTYLNEIIVASGTDGKVRIKTPLGEYRYATNRPVHKVLLKPNAGLYLKVAVASRGKGVLLLNAENMEVK
jgi:WD40 repeat protein